MRSNDTKDSPPHKAEPRPSETTQSDREGGGAAQGIEADLKAVSAPEFLRGDEELVALKREAVLNLPKLRRMRWFYLLQIKHSEQTRVMKELSELLEPFNEVKIIYLIGITGNGKTTLVHRLLFELIRKLHPDVCEADCPIIIVGAPSDGDRGLSWRSLYRAILKKGGDPFWEKKRTLQGDVKKITRVKPKTLGDYREFIEELLKNRKVRLLVIDEAIHLLRFHEYTAIMDTLKSLADLHDTKLLLVGHYNIVDLMTDYDQVERRSEIIHYKRYETEILGEERTKEQEEFYSALKRFLENWPCKVVPNLLPMWHELMINALGSIGLLKIILLRLALLQMRAPGEVFQPRHLQKAMKSRQAVIRIERAALAGEKKLEGLCYGDCALTLEQLESYLKSKQVPGRAYNADAR